MVLGVVLLVECVARVVGAYTVPVDTLVWLGSVIFAGSMTPAFVPPRVAASKAEGNSSLAGSTHEYVGALRSPP